MPKSRVVIYREEDGSVPFFDWFERLPDHARDKVLVAQDKALVRMERLREFAHESRRREADFLRDGIHELRVIENPSRHAVEDANG